jgi:hypothetical protein
MYKYFPVGVPVEGARPGDILLSHRRGFVSSLIRYGEWIHFRAGDWSHVAGVQTPNTLIEALTRGVCQTPISVYTDIECVLIHTRLEGDDLEQGLRFLESCLGQRYGFGIIFGIGLRFLTPGRGLWFGMNGTEICSGLVAQMLCRGWAMFKIDPASITPEELGEYYHVPRLKSLRNSARPE